MSRINLTKLRMQDEDHKVDEVRCKHGFILPLLTSWMSRNPGRRYWVCPYYVNGRSCDFCLWKDDYIDPRSKFVILKLLGRIGELEQRVDALEKIDNKSTRSTNSMESKTSYMNEIESKLDNFDDDLNEIESKLDNFDDDLKKMKENEKKWKNKLAKSKKREKQLWITLLCDCTVGVSFVFQDIFSLKGDSRKLS